MKTNKKSKLTNIKNEEKIESMVKILDKKITPSGSSEWHEEIPSDVSGVKG